VNIVPSKNPKLEEQKIDYTQYYNSFKYFSGRKPSLTKTGNLRIVIGGEDNSKNFQEFMNQRPAYYLNMSKLQELKQS
jgi:hypothetical protein